MPSSGICCKPAKWKRDEIPEHRFDFIDLEPFRDNSLWRKLNYVWLFGATVFSILIYVADLATVVLLIRTWVEIGLRIPTSYEFCQIETGSGVRSAAEASTLNAAEDDKKKALAVNIIIIVSVTVSYIILAWDMIKARRIVKSKSISFAITSTIAYRYYSIKSYLHFCLFQRIMKTSKQLNKFAFFAYFELKNWKSMLFVESPRRGVAIYLMVSTINGRNFFQTLYDMIRAPDSCNNVEDHLRTRYILLILLLFTTAIFIVLAVMFLAALVVYLRLVCIIQGNLKEYCCHLIDKRIALLIRKQVTQKQQKVNPEDLVDKQAIMNLKSAIGSSSEVGGGRANSSAGSDITRFNNSQGNLEPTLPNVASSFDLGHSEPYYRGPMVYQMAYQPSPLNQASTSYRNLYDDPNAYSKYSVRQSSPGLNPALATAVSSSKSSASLSAPSVARSPPGRYMEHGYNNEQYQHPPAENGSYQQVAYPQPRAQEGGVDTLSYDDRFRTFYSAPRAEQRQHYGASGVPPLSNHQVSPMYENTTEVDTVYPDDSVSQVNGENLR